MLPNYDSESVRVGSEEYVNRDTVNRGVLRLLQNDLYLYNLITEVSRTTVVNLADEDYQMTEDDFGKIFVFTGSNNRTFTLVSADDNNGRAPVTIKNRSTTHNFDIDTIGSETIDGTASSVTLTPGDKETIAANGNGNWETM